MTATPSEEAYEDVYEVVGPYSDTMHLWRRRARRVLWVYVAVGLVDGLALPWFDPDWPVYVGVVVTMSILLLCSRYCDKQAEKADKLMMDKFHEIYRTELEKHV